MEHSDALEGKMVECIASTLHTTSKYGVSSITTADMHTSDASSRLNLRPRQFKWTHPLCRKTKSGFCVCAITFQMQSTKRLTPHHQFLPHNVFIKSSWYLTDQSFSIHCSGWLIFQSLAVTPTPTASKSVYSVVSLLLKFAVKLSRKSWFLLYLCLFLLPLWG